MPYNGSGVFSAPSSPGQFNPAVSGSSATPSAWNALLEDIETGLSTAWCRDGQSTVTADIPMANHKFTGLANGSAAADSAALGQVIGAIRHQIFTSPPTTITVTIATPAVLSWTAHGLAVDQAFQVTTTGSLPTGMSPSTTYYVISTGYGANSFQFSATRGGSAVNTSGSQSGTHTGTPYYVPHAKMVYCVAEAQAGGAAGGQGFSGSAGSTSGGGGGGAGGYSRSALSAATIGASKAATVGAGGTSTIGTGGSGGDTSLGSLVLAKGGAGGTASNAGAPGAGGGGGAASGGTGDFKLSGAQGSDGNGGSIITFQATGGAGGNSYFGGGGGATSVNNGTGYSANGYGGGGGGGQNYNSGPTVRLGGSGFQGVLIITEYCWA